MRRRVVLPLALTALIAVPAAGCGKSDKDKYVDDYKPLNDKLLTLGEDLGKAVQSASGQSDTKLQATFSKLDTRFTTLRKDIAGLDTPDDLKDESKALTDALGKTQTDVADIAKAAKESDPGAARTAAQKLVTDAQTVNTSQNKLAKATGAKVGSS